MAGMMNNAERAEEYSALEREFNSNAREITMMIQDAQSKELQRNAPRDVNAQLRELAKQSAGGQVSREISYAGQITESGAINLTIKDLIGTLEERPGLPHNLKITYGVVGNELYPVQLNNIRFKELDENVKVDPQTINFDKINVTQHRAAASCEISNTAIDNAAFDIEAVAKRDFSDAETNLLESKIYSQAKYTATKGGFSDAPVKGTITLGEGAYKEILMAVAEFVSKGFNPADATIVMDAITEAELKATPRAAGQGGFVIEGGKCAGYNYKVSHYINTTDSEGELVATADKYIGIGFFNYLPVQQHGTARLTVDSTSTDVATRNLTVITLNTAYSITDLSTKLNGNTNGKTQAFALYKVAAE